MVKLTKRKGFNFFRSYYDVYNELPTAQDKVDFIDALLDRQFLGVKPDNLKGIAKFAYISQTNSIDSQVKGYEDKTGTRLLNPTAPPTQGVKKSSETPTLQVEEEVQVQVQVEEKEKVKDILLEKETKESFNNWLSYRKEIKKPIKAYSTKIALAKKIQLHGFEISNQVINSSIENSYQGLFWDKFIGKKKESVTFEKNR